MTDDHSTTSGGFSHDRDPESDAPRSRDMNSSAAEGFRAPFLAPPTTDEDDPAPRESDQGEVAMHRLRHPFSVAADKSGDNNE